MTENTVRCEGFRRAGGAFSFGPVKWEQCENVAVAMIEILQNDDQPAIFPACGACWHEALNNENITVLDALPVTKDKDGKTATRRHE